MNELLSVWLSDELMAGNKINVIKIGKLSSVKLKAMLSYVSFVMLS